MKRDRVWYHVPTNKLGIAILDSFFGVPVFIFKQEKPDEVMSHRFCNWVDDPIDPKAFKRKDFIDLGVL